MLPATLLRFSLCDVSFFIARELHKFDQIFKRSASSLQLSIFIRNDDYDEKIPVSRSLSGIFIFSEWYDTEKAERKIWQCKIEHGTYLNFAMTTN